MTWSWLDCYVLEAFFKLQKNILRFTTNNIHNYTVSYFVYPLSQVHGLLNTKWNFRFDGLNITQLLNIKFLM